jgi:hypothetical protein
VLLLTLLCEPLQGGQPDDLDYVEAVFVFRFIEFVLRPQASLNGN